MTKSAKALGRIDGPDIAGKEHALQDRDEIARGDDVRDDLHGPWHAADVENEPRENEGRQECRDDGDLPGDELIAREGRDQEPHAEGGEKEQRGSKRQHKKRSVQRHAEQKNGYGNGGRHAAHAEHEIGNELGDQDFPDRNGRHHQRLHRAAFPFAGDHQRRQQGSRECHDDRDEPWRQIIAAFHRWIEPNALLHGNRKSGRMPGGGCLCAKPTRPDLLNIAFDEACVVGIDTIDQNADWRCSAMHRLAREIGFAAR